MDISVFIERVRTGLGHPHEAELGDDMILMQAWETITMYRADLNLGGQQWGVKFWLFTIPGSNTVGSSLTIDTMKLGVTDFQTGVSVYTYSSSNPYHQRRTIDLINIDQFNMYFDGPEIPISTGYIPHVAAAMSIYNSAGS